MTGVMEADFVIIGSGSAGSVLVDRLSEDARSSVLVIEFGGTDFGPLIQMPAALSYPMGMSRYDWGFSTEPEPNLNNRCLATPRGKVIGGSSSINGMVYVRGHARDFDHWAQSGATGWSYCDVLPYFRRMECWNDGGHGGDGKWRGKSGPLNVQRGSRTNPLFAAFELAGSQAGFELTADYNGEKQEGFGPMDQTIRGGRRWSAANAYLKPALRRSNASLVRAFARRIVFEGGRAVGVEVDIGGRTELIRCHREVIVSAAPLNSPKLLKLSGIGPGPELAEHGISVLADRPGVGGNLQDHLEVLVQHECLQPVTLAKYWNLVGKMSAGFRWLLFKKGIGASNHFESAAFLRSAPGVEYPDIQYHFLPIAVRYDGQSDVSDHGFQAHVGPMRSNSRGSVTLRSSEPKDPPVIRFNYMSDPKDWTDFRHCIRLTREILSQDALDPYRGREINPGMEMQGDQELDEYVRNHAESAYHPCGTCRMGSRTDRYAVVDPECRVIGVEGLRVVDSSIFPRITNGNLNGPSIMVGEKAADYIRGHSPLAREDSEPWINPRWRESDR